MSAAQASTIAEALYSFAAHARFARAMSLVVFGTAFGSFALRQLIGVAGLTAIIIGELILVVLMLLARRKVVTWNSFIPISLGLYLAWSSLSLFWSYYPRTTISGVLSQLAFAGLALAVAATRDSIHILRSLADVLRLFLSISLVLEIIAGVLIDSPIPFLSIQGNLVSGGGTQGLFGNRNAFSIIALIGLVLFIVEYRTKSISAKVSTYSLVVAGLSIIFSQSPVGWATVFAVGILSAILFALRAMKDAARRASQIGLASAATLGVVLAWMFRGSILEWLDDSPVMQFRLNLWDELSRIASMKFLNGWGWAGSWPEKTQPFSVMRFGGSNTNSGLNIYLDAWLQLGLIGAVLLLILIGLAFVRSWILASSKKSELYVWAPLVLGVLIFSGLAESFALTEWGWVLLVVITAQSSRELSWRNRSRE